ncbi:MAG: UDP-phosphate glucose phosphotransferase, partial [Caulobacteraceae bacterium]
MTHAASLHVDPPARAMDAIALQALAADAGAGSKGVSRRGPFRPQVWLNARQKHSSRLAPYYFRAFDVVAVSAISLLCAWAAAPDSLIHTELSRVLPFVIGPLVLLGLLRSLGLYRFQREASAMVHLASVSAVAVFAGACAITVGVLTRGPHVEMTGLLVWTGISVLVVYGLHMA